MLCGKEHRSHSWRIVASAAARGRRLPIDDFAERSNESFLRPTTR